MKFSKFLFLSLFFFIFIASLSAQTAVDPNQIRPGSFQNGAYTFPGPVFFKSGAPWYDVKAFGAVCDGTTNDTTAIQNALNAAASNLTVGGAGGGYVEVSGGA